MSFPVLSESSLNTVPLPLALASGGTGQTGRSGAALVLGFTGVSSGGDQGITSDTAVKITGLEGVPISGGEVWAFRILMTVTTPAAGSKFQVTHDGSSTLECWINSKQAAAAKNVRLTATNTLSALATGTNTTEQVEICGMILGGGNTTNLEIAAASVTNLQTTTIKAHAVGYFWRVS